MPCNERAGYGYWDTYREAWNTNPVIGLKRRRIRLKFDGGLEHKDGTQWAIAGLQAGMDVDQILISTKGLQPEGADPVKIDLGTVAFEKDCQGQPVCEKLTSFLECYDASTKQCNQQVSCGPWTCADSCTPDCCPELPPLDCCPDEDDEGKLCCGKSDLVLTLHGTPAACSELIITFIYQ